nr:protein kinase superfamily protein [Tanacetum cinerariifolium]
MIEGTRAASCHSNPALKIISTRVSSSFHVYTYKHLLFTFYSHHLSRSVLPSLSPASNFIFITIAPSYPHSPPFSTSIDLSFKRLAIVGDPNFNTFEDSYPYVVRKLLSDNSLNTRKILHSVMLNNKKELQWQKVALFLRVGVTSTSQRIIYIR